MNMVVRVDILSHDGSLRVDRSAAGRNRSRIIDGKESSFLPEETVPVARCVAILANNCSRFIDVPRPSESGAGKIESGKIVIPSGVGAGFQY